MRVDLIKHIVKLKILEVWSVRLRLEYRIINSIIRRLSNIFILEFWCQKFHLLSASFNWENQSFTTAVTLRPKLKELLKHSTAEISKSS